MTKVKFAKEVNAIIDKHIKNACAEYVEFAKRNKMCIVGDEFDPDDYINYETKKLRNSFNLNQVKYDLRFSDPDTSFGPFIVKTEKELSSYCEEE